MSTDAFERAFRREKAARQQAEDELEQLSREIYLKNTELEKLNQDLIRNQAQLVQSEKLATVGQLASGVAHEINNPLGFCLSNLSTLKEYVDEIGARLAKSTTKPDNGLTAVMADLPLLVQETQEGLESIRSIVKDLRNYYRDAGDDFAETNISDCIHSTLNMLRNQIGGYNVSLDLGETPLIQANPGKLNQVFSNLIMNALQAMAHDGRLVIETSAGDRYAEIRITDNGPGIPDEIKQTIFEPFHTTKPMGEGTGLGLSICHAIIVDNHKGQISARDANPGPGTTFEILLPLAR
jgi:two-component system NtrC family sensor kinase